MGDYYTVFYFIFRVTLEFWRIRLPMLNFPHKFLCPQRMNSYCLTVLITQFVAHCQYGLYFAVFYCVRHHAIHILTKYEFGLH